MDNELKGELRRIVLSLVIFIVLFIADHFTLLQPSLGNKWVLLILYLIPYFLSGFEVVKECFEGIAGGDFLDEAFLMTLATVGAFITGEYAEAVAVMLFFQVGEWFQSYAVGKSRASIKNLMDIAPEYANIESAEGKISTVDPSEVRIGDILIIKPGERVPVDGTVLGGASMINTAALTGESVPRAAHAGDQLISGCINGESTLKMRADKLYEDSTVSKILELVENASSRKSHAENFITRFARYYTPIVVFGALALAIIPSLVFGDHRTWILRACTFLVISCPCALVISVPLSFFGGIGAASNAGILVKGSNYLELAAKIDTLVTDKTGTLTVGEFKVAGLNCRDGVSESELLSKAALAESLSTHPIAVSIREACEQQIDASRVTNMENVSGKGIIATVGQSRIYAGNAKLMADVGLADEAAKHVGVAGATVVYIGEDDMFLGTISVADRIKDGANEAIKDMKKSGIRKIVMLTGDKREVGEAVGDELGIDEVYSELMPTDKVNIVEEIIAKLSGGTGDSVKRALAFVGDGINDAPVLTRADVGIAMGSLGSDAAIEAADIVIMDDDIRRIPTLMKIARKTRAIAKENIVFAIAVKILILVLGAIGIASIWWAVFADVGVAMICIVNSMRTLLKDSAYDVGKRGL